MKGKSISIGRFALGGVAAAAVCLVLSMPTESWALGLGRLSVQSALGESLKADIDISSLTPEEAANLKVKVASPETYRAAGVDYNAVLPSTAVSLERRADGRPYLVLSSDRAVQEPFVDVILELSWSSGHLVREYTLLFDPPVSKTAAPAAVVPSTAPVMGTAGAAAEAAATPLAAPVPPAGEPVPAQAATGAVEAASAPEAAAMPAAAEPTPAPVPIQVPEPAPVAAQEPAPVSAPAPVPEPLPELSNEPLPELSSDSLLNEPPAPAVEAAKKKRDAAATSEPLSASDVRVNTGDTLSGIAKRVKHSGVSLDQMLVGLYRANPDAFVRKNMNRLKSGVVLSVPEAEKALSVSQPEAHEIIEAQSADFNSYRSRLAASVPTAPGEGSQQRASGKVQTEVHDRKQVSAAPDKLTLSKGASVSGKAGNEDRLVKDRAKKESTTRVAELSKNIEALKELKGAAKPAPAPVPPSIEPKVAPVAPPPPPPPAPVPPPAPIPAPAPPPPPPMPDVAPSVPVQAMQPAASQAGMDSASAMPAMEAASRPVPPPPPLIQQPEEPGFLSALLDNPMLPAAAAVAAVVLAGFGLYKWRGRRKGDSGETSFLESRLQPDSFFGASGGQRIDTRDGGTGGPSSMSYSLSQLDAIGDVDPVAEADVYLAYGRDLQAEEILKEAMRGTPDRLAIRLKLLEVYAKRRDTKGFEQLAVQLYGLTQGQGEDWAKAQEMGRAIDLENPLYAPGGRPEAASAARAPNFDNRMTEPMGDNSSIPPTEFSAPPAPRPSGVDVVLDLSVPAPRQAKPAPAPVKSTSMDFDLGSFPPVSAPAPAPKASSSSRDFDLGGISLDLGSTSPSSSRGAPQDEMLPVPEISTGDDFGGPDIPDMTGLPDSGNPMMRKIELAEEFRQIGDLEGARDLLEEVVAKGDGSVRSKAKAMLDQLR